MDIKKIEAHGKILLEFPVLHSGWEYDAKGWIVEAVGKRKIILTNHNVTHVAKKNELKEKIKEYLNAIKETEKALKMIK